MSNILLVSFFSIFLALSSVLEASSNSSLNFSGETNYTAHKTKSLITTFNMEYRLEIYKPSHTRWVAYIGGKVNPDYDVFGKELKTNVFTTLGVDF